MIKYTFRFRQYAAKWEDIAAFYNKDKELPIRAAPKLTDKHIKPNNFAKVKVKYATQIVGHTVAASIWYICQCVGGLPSSGMAYPVVESTIFLFPGKRKEKHSEVWSSSNIAGEWLKGGGEWVVITDLKNMADYIALQYFVFLQKDLATFTTNKGWSFLISRIWQTIRSSKHLRRLKRREIR